MLSRFYTLTDHPTGLPKRELFSLESQELPDLDEGEVRIRNHWLSVDPYMRGRMSGVHTYVAPFQLGKPMEGGAIGEVIASNHPNLKVGDKVSHMGGWRDIAQLPGDSVTVTDPSSCRGFFPVSVRVLPSSGKHWIVRTGSSSKPRDCTYTSTELGALSLSVPAAASAYP